MSKLIGTDPNQAPSNADLGTMAYQNANDLNIGLTTIAAESKDKDSGVLLRLKRVGNGTWATLAIEGQSYRGNSRIAFVDSDYPNDVLTTGTSNGGGAAPFVIDYEHETDTFQMISFATSRFTINSSGFVGIGTDSPNSKLEVATSDNVNSYSDGAIQVVSSDPIAFVSPSNLNPSLNRWGFKLREVAEGDFTIHDYRQGVSRLLIDDRGYIGMGNQGIGAPDAVLNVASSLNETVAHFNNTDGSPGNYPVVHIERTHNLSQPDASDDAALFIEDHETNWMIACKNKGGTTVFTVDGYGAMSATSKSFDIEHPTKEGMRLHHGSLEGPEHGVYVRGRLKDSNIIELPDYWEGLVDLETITVQLTAIGGKQDLWVSEIIGTTIMIGCEGPANCFYFVQAERKDIDKFDVEYEA